MEHINLQQSETMEGLFVFPQHSQHFSREKQHLQQFAATSVTGRFKKFVVIFPVYYTHLHSF